MLISPVTAHSLWGPPHGAPQLSPSPHTNITTVCLRSTLNDSSPLSCHESVDPRVSCLLGTQGHHNTGVLESELLRVWTVSGVHRGLMLLSLSPAGGGWPKPVPGWKLAAQHP